LKSVKKNVRRLTRARKLIPYRRTRKYKAVKRGDWGVKIQGINQEMPHISVRG